MLKSYIKLINFLLLIIFGEFFHESVFNESIETKNVENIKQEKEDVVGEEMNDSFSKKQKIFILVAFITFILAFFYYNSEGGSGGSININDAALNHTITNSTMYLSEKARIQELLLELNEVTNWEFFLEVEKMVTKAFSDKTFLPNDLRLDFQICLKKFLFNSELESIKNPKQSEQILKEIVKIINKIL